MGHHLMRTPLYLQHLWSANHPLNQIPKWQILPLFYDLQSFSPMFPITIAGIPYIYILHPFPFNDLPAPVEPFIGWCCWFSQSRTSWRTAKSAQCLTLWDHGNSQWSEECLVEGGADFNLLSVLNMTHIYIHIICFKKYNIDYIHYDVYSFMCNAPYI